VNLLERYIALVLSWNRRINLTGVRTADEAARVLVLDAMACLAFLPEGGTLVDLGSGAGTPGVPIAVARAGMRVLLVEASRKRAAFLELLLRDLAIGNADVLHARAEALGRTPVHRERYDAVVARAVAGLPVLAEYALPLLRVGGIAVFPKGGIAEEEEASAGRALALLGGVAAVHTAPLSIESRIIVVQKIARTPEAYPRRPGVPARRPL